MVVPDQLQKCLNKLSFWSHFYQRDKNSETSQTRFIWKVLTSCKLYLAITWCACLLFCLFSSLSCHSTLDYSSYSIRDVDSPSAVFIVTPYCEWQAVCNAFSCKDGVFRKYQGARTKDDFLGFVQDQKWKSIEPVSSWFGPSSFLWVSVFLVFASVTVAEATGVILAHYFRPRVRSKRTPSIVLVV